MARGKVLGVEFDLDKEISQRCVKGDHPYERLIPGKYTPCFPGCLCPCHLGGWAYVIEFFNKGRG